MGVGRISLTRSIPQVSVPNIAGNPLPKLLQTPSGLAILEIQGTINYPAEGNEDILGCFEDGDSESLPSKSNAKSRCRESKIGHLVFPDYDDKNFDDTAWMKRVYMYVGHYQRLTGEVKILPKAIAILGRSKDRGNNYGMYEDNGPKTVENPKNYFYDDDDDRDIQLEILEIVKYKILFANRPEPVGGEVY